MIYNKFINCPTLEQFNSKLSSGEIVDQHIVFIQDTKQIWTYGIFYGGSDFDQSTFEKLENLADLIVTDGKSNSYLSADGTYNTPIYYVPYDLINLSNESISSEILSALGSPEEFDNIVNAIESGNQLGLKNDEDNTIISLNSLVKSQEGGGQLLHHSQSLFACVMIAA